MLQKINLSSVKTHVLFLILWLLLGGCHKFDAFDKETILLLSEITYCDGGATKFEYDGYNRIIKVKEFVGKELSQSILFTYNDAGDLVAVAEISHDDGFRRDVTITKEGNVMTMEEEYVTRVAELNAQGLVEKMTHSGNTVGENGEEGWWKGVELFEYYGKNVSRVESTYTSSGSGDSQTDIDTYSYYDRKSPFYYCNTPLWYKVDFIYRRFGIGAINNIKTNSYSFMPVTIKYEYRYNAAGLPVSCKKIGNFDGRIKIEISHFKYVKRAPL